MKDFSYTITRRFRKTSSAGKWYVTIKRQGSDFGDYASLRRTLFNQDFSWMISHVTSGSGSEITAVIKDEEAENFSFRIFPIIHLAEPAEPEPVFPFKVKVTGDMNRVLELCTSLGISRTVRGSTVSFQTLGDAMEVFA